MPKVSFIIPYYNSGATIQETLDSIFAQTFTDFDVWIVDDGSTDPTSIKKLEEISHSQIKILHQENAGPGVARNLAIRQTNADLIIPLDADDKILPGTIQLALPYLADEKTGVVYGDIKFFGERTEVKKQEEFNISTALLYNQVAMCAIIKKEVFESSGYFDEYMSKPGLEDWEFWIRITERGWKMVHVPQIFFEVRVTGTSRTYTSANKNLEDLKAYVYTRHQKLLAREYHKLFYERKKLLETPDYRIGSMLLEPLRMIKRFFKS